MKLDVINSYYIFRIINILVDEKEEIRRTLNATK